MTGTGSVAKISPRAGATSREVRIGREHQVELPFPGRPSYHNSPAS